MLVPIVARTYLYELNLRRIKFPEILSLNKKVSPRCIVIAGPNGSGKTTFARDFLQREAGVVRFVNADLIAAGLSPLNPDLAKVAAGKLFLRELDRLADTMTDFSFETTLSGKGYRPRFIQLRNAGYRIEIVYLRLASPQLALKRIAARVRHGGHDIPKEDVLRRFDRSWQNFLTVYRPLADRWAVFDNSGAEPVLQEHWP
jgi:predicted ABC-type ATPase